MKQHSLFAVPEYVRVEIIKALAQTFNGRQIEIPCPLEGCGGRGWAFVNPLNGYWAWICEKCQTLTGSDVKQ